MATEGKTSRWNLRVAAETNDLVREAARLSRRNLSDFVVEATAIEAERVLADRTRFELDPPAWDAFVALLDRPGEANPRLARLFGEPTVFS